MIYYNCHTHIFSAQYVPNNVVGVPIMNVLATDPISARLTKLFGKVRYRKLDSSVERVARFAEIGLGTRQEVIFNYLEDYYKGWGDVRFVVLMMDMEQMGAGNPLAELIKTSCFRFCLLIREKPNSQTEINCSIG
jgi:hypothetical protein